MNGPKEGVQLDVDLEKLSEWNGDHDCQVKTDCQGLVDK